MKSIVDEGVPIRLVRALMRAGCEISAFPNEWKGLKNGKLLAQITSEEFDRMVTADKKFRHQQNMRKWAVALVVLPSPFFPDIAHLVDVIAQTVNDIEPGTVFEIRMDGSAEQVFPS